MVLSFILISISLYLTVSYIFWRDVNEGRGTPTKLALFSWLVALLAHGGALSTAIFIPQGIDLSLFNAISLSAFLISLILLLASMRRALSAVGIVILPLSALCVALTPIETSNSLVDSAASASLGIQLHIVTSMLAYSLLIVASIQALVINRQISYLKIKDKSKHKLVSTLPTLDVMESFLFTLVTSGVFLLTLSLLSGWLYHEDIFAQHLMHKTVLSVMAWLVFSIVIVGKHLYGWRTNTAVRLILIATVLLVLGYLGSKFVLEVVLDRI